VITEKDQRHQSLITILGMHRSGTSLITHMMHASGLQIASDLMNADTHNPDGYWESVRLNQILEYRLAELHSRWHDWRPTSSTPRSDQFVRRLKSYLLSELSDFRSFVVKDPRLCLFVQDWMTATSELGITPHYIIILRDPKDVCVSLAKRDGMPIDKASLLWMRHVKEAELNTRGHARIILLFDEVVSSPLKCLDKIRQTWPVMNISDEAAALAATLVREELNRSSKGLLGEAHISWATRLYKVLSHPSQPEPLSDLDELYDEFEHWSGCFAPLLEALEDKNRELQRNLADVTAELNKAKWLLGDSILSSR